MSSSLSLAIPLNPRKHGVFGGFLMLMTNPMTNDFCRLKTLYVTFFVMNFVMGNRENRWRDIDSQSLK